MSWTAKALCRFEHGDTFENLPRVDQIEVCQRCPVRTECLIDAIDIEAKIPSKPYGVRGGLPGEARFRLVKMRRADQKAAAA